MSHTKAHVHSYTTPETTAEIHQTFHVVINDTVELYVAIGISAVRDEAMSKNIMYTIIQSLQDYLISSMDKAIYERFEDGIKTLNGYLAHKNMEDIGNISVAIGLLHEHKLHITKTGLAEIYLLRKGTSTNITEGFTEEQDSTEYFENIATGELESNDHILITTRRMSSYLGEAELGKYFQEQLGNASFMNLERFLSDLPDAAIGFIGFQVHDFSSSTESTSFTKKLQSGSLQDTIVSLLHQQKKHLRDPRTRSKYYTLGALLVLILLVISITASLSGSQSAEVNAEFTTQFNNAKNELALAKNNNIKGDREGAREHLLTAKQVVTSFRDQGVAIADVDDLLKEIEAQEDIANKVERIDTSVPFITLATSLGSDTAKGLIATPNGLMVYSSTGVYGPFINQETQASSGKKIESQDLIVSAGYFDDTKGLMLKLTPDKIAEFIGGAFLFQDSSGTTWKSGSQIDDFGNNIYILGTEQIWRYTRSRDDYKGPTGWLKKVEPTLASAISFAVDGSVYTLHTTGEIKRFFKNQSVPLEAVDLPEGSLTSLNEESKIYTEPDFKRLYVLNHETSTIISFVKLSAQNQIVFEKQYYFPDIDIADFTVSRTEDELFVLSKDSNITKIGL